MGSEDSFLVLVHHRGSIKRKTRSGMKFTDNDPLCIIVTPTTTYDALVSSVLEKLGLKGVKRVKKFFYRIPTAVLHDTVKYDCFTIGSDEDLQVMFLCRRQFPEVRTPELLAKLVDVVSSSGGSNQNANTIAAVAGSSSRPAVASSFVPVSEPPMQPVASPLFAVDLSGTVGDEARYVEHVPTEVHCPTPAGVGEGLFDDADDDDVEPDMIADDSGDDLGTTDPGRATGGSSSGTQQYPPHFSSLDMDAMRQETFRRSKTAVTVKGQLTSRHVCWRPGTCTGTTMLVPPIPNCSDPSPQAEQHRMVCDVLKRDGALSERHVKGVRLRPPPLDECAD
ncbi:hypothetical protein Ahy_A04g018342 [Arachis hypogaea]|uniref:Mutator sub-class protein n=1 Tax=Arachis hypogaea TaxID=3818 RepID=A0A445DDE4_ARAHY|nr:hypothetical protein Ahy_A04g018342 [Arachis hypogaea]